MSARLVIADLIQLNVNSTRPSGSLFYYDGSTYRHSSIATIIGSTLSVTGLGSFTGSLSASSLKIGSTLVVDNSLVLLNVTVPASTLGTGIAVNKLVAQTASKALVSDSSGYITASSVTSTELGYVSGVTSAIQTQFSNTQPLDSTLTSLAAYNTNGILTQTATDTFTGRTLTGTSNRLSISNGNGVSGNPTFDIDTGYVGQTSITTLGTIGTGTWNGTVIGSGYGGTGLNTVGTADQVLAMNHTAGALEYKTITGTTNQITVTSANGSITLSLPQSINTGATVTFAQITGSTSVTTPSLTNAGTLALSATSTNVITFSTNGSEAARIDSNGFIGIGASPNVTILELNKATSTGIVTARGTAIAIRGNTYTDTGSSALATVSSFTISAPTFSSPNAGSVYSDISALHITGAASVAGSATATRTWALDCRGAVRIGSSVSTAGNNYILGVYKASTATSSTDIALNVAETSNPASTNTGTIITVNVDSGTGSSCAQNLTNTIGIQTVISHRGTGTITSAAAIKVDTLTRSGTGTITTAYGLWIRQQSVTGVTTGIALYQDNSNDTSRFAGNVSFGKTTVPGYTVDVSGIVNVAGTTSNTFRWNAATTAPSTTSGVTTTNRYGGNTNILGDPNAWCLVNIAGTDYKIPLYS